MNAFSTGVIVSVLILSWATGIVSAPAQDSREADAVFAIRKRYASINEHLAKYRKVKKELTGFSTEGGELTAYFEGDAPRKIAAEYQGESGRALEEYYYWDGELQFVYRKEDSYTEPMSGKVSRSSETRFYFANGQLIRWLASDGKPMRRGDAQFAEEQNKYLATSALFVTGARLKNTVIEAPE